MYVIIHGSMIIRMCSKAVWWTKRVIQFTENCSTPFISMFLFSPRPVLYTPLIRAWGFQCITSHFQANVGETIFISI